MSATADIPFCYNTPHAPASDFGGDRFAEEGGGGGEYAGGGAYGGFGVGGLMGTKINELMGINGGLMND